MLTSVDVMWIMTALPSGVTISVTQKPMAAKLGAEMTATVFRIHVMSLITFLILHVNTALAQTVFLVAPVTQFVLTISPFVESLRMNTDVAAQRTQIVQDLVPIMCVMETPMGA